MTKVKTPEEQSADVMTRMRAILDGDIPTRADFLELTQTLVRFVNGIDARLSEDVATVAKELKTLAKQMQDENKMSVSEMKERLNELFVGDRLKEMEHMLNSSVGKELEKQVSKVDLRLSTVRDGEHGKHGRDGKNADENQVATKVVAMLTPLLEEQIKKLIKDEMPQRLGAASGGTSSGGVKFALNRIVKKETPSGAINGSNTAYTVSQDIFAVFSLAINGQVITDDEYTIAGRTITMNTALPASLSGLSFRIVYV